MIETSRAEEFDDVIRLELPAAFEFLPLLGSSIRILLKLVDKLDEEQLQTVAYNLELAAYEVGTNIVEHAYDGKGGLIDVTFCLDQNRTFLTIELRDDGSAFNFDASEIRLPEMVQTRGYGLFLIRELVDEVKQWSANGYNHWRLVKQLQP